MGYPSYLWREAFDVVLLFLQHVSGNEHWEITVLDAHSLDFGVEPSLYLFPDEVRSRLKPSAIDLDRKSEAACLQDIATCDIVVIQHVTLCKHLLVPAWEVIFFRDINPY